MNGVQAIETEYDGIRFRSRTEARWAVFFKTLGLEYEYEKEAFALPHGNYLPDFWIPKLKCWIEVKGTAPDEREEGLAADLAYSTGCDVFILAGQPKLPPSIHDHGYVICEMEDGRHLMIRNPASTPPPGSKHVAQREDSLTAMLLGLDKMAPAIRFFHPSKLDKAGHKIIPDFGVKHSMPHFFTECRHCGAISITPYGMITDPPAFPCECTPCDDQLMWFHALSEAPLAAYRAAISYRFWNPKAGGRNV